MKKVLLILILGGWGVTWAQAQTIAIYPFTSQDILLGMAISEQVAEGLKNSDQPFKIVLDPVVSPTLIPPLVIESGYINPLVLLDNGNEIGKIENYNGVALVRDVLGVDIALAGEIIYRDENIHLDLFIATPKGSFKYLLSASENNPALLVDNTFAYLNSHLNQNRIFTPSKPLSLKGNYGDYIRGLALLSGGFAIEAKEILTKLISEPETTAETNIETDIEVNTEANTEAETNTETSTETTIEVDAEGNTKESIIEIGPDQGNESNLVRQPLTAELATKISSLLAAIDLTSKGELGPDPALNAALALILPELSEQGVITVFEDTYKRLELPLTQVWVGALKDDVNDRDGANKAFDLAANYPYGLAARASYKVAHEFLGAREEILTLRDSRFIGPLLGAIVVAQSLEDLKLEKELAVQLTKVAPYLAYPLERLSFMAFDEDDPIAAAEALIVATNLFPNNDLYWTNLGWAYYLLNFLERSEIASQKAVALNANEIVAWFNLGLVQVVTDRLDQAMDSYAKGLALDPQVNDEAIVDLENALELYPYAVGVHFALATLYEAEGQLEKATAQFKAYQQRATYLDPTSNFLSKAKQRYEALTAPPAPISLSEEIELFLGRQGLEITSYHPGDRLYPKFEVFTEGIELPREIFVGLELSDENKEVLISSQTQMSVPQNTVGLLVDDIPLTLPSDLLAGNYQLDVSAWAIEDKKTINSIVLEITNDTSFLSQLLSHGVVMRTLSDNSPLYGHSTLTSKHSDNLLIKTLLEELQENVEVAEEALSPIDNGRFKGFTGGELFSKSTEKDVRDFLSFLLDSGISDTEFSFVDGYAQWAIEGAQSLP